MRVHTRLDSATAAIIDEAIRLRDMGQHAPSLQLLSDHALSIELIGRVLCDPERRRGRPRRRHARRPSPHRRPDWWHWWPWVSASARSSNISGR